MGHGEAALRRLTERVRGAAAGGEQLDIRGGGTKAFYAEAPRGEPLSLAELAGVSSYEPSELVVTARAGTPLEELEALLADAGQCLPFEPPRFAPGGTVGGMVAAGLTGPARAYVGSLRDFLLGATLIDGRGEVLHFGGEVMKNVAGYDVSRVLAGSWGILGVICEVSIKVLPRTAATATLVFACDETQALAQLEAWSAQALPLRASSWGENRLAVRLAGAESAVRAALARLGGSVLEPETAAALWQALRDHADPFFQPTDAELAEGSCLWRVSVPPRTAPLALAGRQWIEWGGAQRWWRTSMPAARVREIAAAAGGHATLVRAADKTAGAFARPSAAVLTLNRRLKLAFDPARVFNGGRLFPDL
jgi:FAD/FMN-containing dehydrogenase